MRLDATAEIEVVFLRAVTCESTIERQRYELLGNEEVAAPAGRFVARRWRYTALSSGWSRDLWVAGDVVVAYEGTFALEGYEPGRPARDRSFEPAPGAHPAPQVKDPVLGPNDGYGAGSG